MYIYEFLFFIDALKFYFKAIPLIIADIFYQK